MKGFNTIICFIAVLVFIGCSQQQDSESAVADTDWEEDLPEYIDPDWAKDRIWDDGRGEVIYYSCFMELEDERQNFEMVYITALETFSRERNAKTDDKGQEETFQVLKHNQIATVKTDVFPYHYLNSFYFKRDNSDLVHTATYSTQEWEGNTYKAINYSDGGYALNYSSYQDGIGQGKAEIENFPWFEDQLPFTLRSLKFKDGLTFERQVMSTMMNNNAKQQPIYDARFEIKLDEALWEVKVTLEEGKESFYYFFEKSPHLMKQMVAYDGRRMLFTNANRSKYWVAPIPVDQRYQ